MDKGYDPEDKTLHVGFEVPKSVVKFCTLY
jgi:hypothetical protein